MRRQRFESGEIGMGYDVVICLNCGAAFADGIPGQDDLERYYADRSKYTYGEIGDLESPYDVRRFDDTVANVSEFISGRNVAVLDVGCATGGLLASFKKHGYNNVIGADPSADCARFALFRHNVEVRIATVSSLSQWSDRFDIILMLGVLEHVRDVNQTLRILAQRLLPGGHLHIAVPDVEGLEASRNAPYQQFSMEHINFFSRQSLDHALEAAGFDRVMGWNTTVDWREGVTEPIVSGLYIAHKSASTAADSLNRSSYDRLSEPAVRRYIDASAKADIAVVGVIERLLRDNRPFWIWGAGALTRRLLAETAISHAKIKGFIDSNPHYHGDSLAGTTIYPPEAIILGDAPIFICSYAFEKEIVARARSLFGAKVEIITLPK
jgi:SAM-dependent methyltransferase